MTLHGADPETVRRALRTGDPLSGTFGFAGSLDGRLVRDVLGRVPLFVERNVIDAERVDDAFWAYAPGPLDDPVAFPAGHVSGPDGPERRWSLPERSPDGDPTAAVERLADAIDAAGDAVIAGGAMEPGAADVPVAFSGGVDSALVATLFDGPLYVVGFPGAKDVEAARDAARAMDREEALRVVELDLDRLERAVPTVARATGRTNPMDLSIALPLALVAERVAADGYGRLAVGQGADELFGGYEKVARLDHRVEADTVAGAVREQIETLPEQLPRDVLAIRAGGVDPVAPLCHDAVVEASLQLPESLLVAGERRKVALRRVAGDRLPDAVADREKKAVQYGSLVSRELDRLARQAGFKRRMDDHVRKYVESRLDD